MASDLFVQAQEALQTGDDALVIRLLESGGFDLDGASAFVLGVAYHRQGQLQDAARVLELATRLGANNLQAWLARASVLLDLKALSSVVDVCLTACAQFPATAEVWFCLAVAREATADIPGALEAYATALSIEPGHAGSLQNYAARLLLAGRSREAVVHALEFARRYPYAHAAQFLYGDACLSAGLHEEAAAAFSRAVSLRPADARTLLHAGFAHGQCERFDEAQRLLDAAWSNDPEVVCAYRQSIYRDGRRLPLDARSLFLQRHFDAIERCDWRSRDRFLESFTTLIHDSPPGTLSEMALGFRALAMGVTPKDQLALARRIASSFLSTVSDTSATGDVVSMPSAESAGQRICLGYISPDFREHPTGMLATNIFGWHDRDRFSVTAYFLDEGSDGCEIRRRIADGCDRTVDLSRLDNRSAARRIAEDGIDILVDLVGYGDRGRPEILAQRPAKIQISVLAYVATQGASWIDYFIGDCFALPDEADAAFAEALIRLPAGLFLCSYAQQPLAAPPDRGVEKLPANARVLAAMHSHYKIDPAVFTSWMSLLRRFPDAVLWLLDGSPETVGNLCSAAEAAGVHRDRLVFAAKTTHDQHLARLQLATLALDTVQCNGGATTADALVAGVPVVSCTGGSCAQRMSSSLLNAAGLSDLVVESLAEYEALVERLLENPDALREMREAMLRNRDVMPFYQPKSWVSDFEQALLMAWDINRGGNPPASMVLLR